MALDHNILLEAGTNEFEIVEFLINADHSYSFCINVAKVREVIKIPEIIHMPDMHKAVIGTANIRQDIMPIIDLGYWLKLRGLSDEQTRINKKVIVTYANYVSNGFLVDEVVRIHRITWADVKDHSAITDYHLADSVLGVVKIQDRLVQLLDFEGVMEDVQPSLAQKSLVVNPANAAKRNDFKMYIAEDSNVMRHILVDTFTKAGYQIEAFSNGADLLNAVSKIRPDIVITDLEMPVASGDYVVRRIREKYNKFQLPVVVFSSMSSESNEQKLLLLGASSFIGKPKMSRLIELIDEFLITSGE